MTENYVDTHQIYLVGFLEAKLKERGRVRASDITGPIARKLVPPGTSQREEKISSLKSILRKKLFKVANDHPRVSGGSGEYRPKKRFATGSGQHSWFRWDGALPHPSTFESSKSVLGRVG
jgi:hypothetical protein